jgi:hypothetical protein
MRIARLKLTTAIVAATTLVAAAGIGTGYALTRPGLPSASAPAPQPPEAAAQKDEPKPEDWTPIPTLVKDGKIVRQGSAPVPTAFPQLNPPNRTKPDPDYLGTIAKLCPRVLGDDPPTVLPNDDTYRRLLKARLHQGRLYFKKTLEVIEIGRWDRAYFSELLLCLNDMREVAIELWASDPKVLVPWLEELVIIGKMVEQFIQFRSAAGSEPPQILHAAQRHRLEAEAALWKAKNAQRQGGK